MNILFHIINTLFLPGKTIGKLEFDPRRLRRPLCNTSPAVLSKSASPPLNKSVPVRKCYSDEFDVQQVASKKKNITAIPFLAVDSANGEEQRKIPPRKAIEKGEQKAINNHNSSNGVHQQEHSPLNGDTQATHGENGSASGRSDRKPRKISVPRLNLLNKFNGKEDSKDTSVQPPPPPPELLAMEPVEELLLDQVTRHYIRTITHSE